jgi:hypothetical protein
MRNNYMITIDIEKEEPCLGNMDISKFVKS